MDVARPDESGGNALEDPLGGMLRFRDVADMAQRHGFDACFTSACNLNDTTGIPDCGAVETRCFGEQAARNVQLQERFDSEPLGNSPKPPRQQFLARPGAWDLRGLLVITWFVSDPTRPTERLFSATRSMRCRTAVPADDLPEGDFSEEKQNEIATHFDVSLLTVRTQPVSSGRFRTVEVSRDSDRSGRSGSIVMMFDDMACGVAADCRNPLALPGKTSNDSGCRRVRTVLE